jgi:hypothetical protein
MSDTLHVLHVPSNLGPSDLGHFNSSMYDRPLHKPRYP